MEHRALVSFLGCAEPVAALSHLGAALFSAWAWPRLQLHVRGNPRRAKAVRHYVVGVALMFLVSGIYHVLAPDHPLRRTFQHLDHAMIWVAIASTISAVHVLAELRPYRLVNLVWGLAGAGALIEQLSLGQLSPWVSPLLYIGMGWVGLIPFALLVRARGWLAAVPLVVAGVSCTLGGVADALDWPLIQPGVVEGHEVMHLLIVLGMGSFLVAVDRCGQLLHPESESAPLPALGVPVEVPLD